MQKKLKKSNCMYLALISFIYILLVLVTLIMSLFFYINNGWGEDFGVKLQPRIRSIEVFEIILIIIF